jgi:hypothetical protein
LGILFSLFLSSLNPQDLIVWKYIKGVIPINQIKLMNHRERREGERERVCLRERIEQLRRK